MSIRLRKPSRALSLAGCVLLVVVPAWSGEAASQAVQASGHASAQAIGHAVNSLAASGRVTLAVSAVPLAVGGSISTQLGVASTAIAETLVQGTAPIGAPLPVTQEIITVVPPDVALRQSPRPNEQVLPQ